MQTYRAAHRFYQSALPRAEYQAMMSPASQAAITADTLASFAEACSDPAVSDAALLEQARAIRDAATEAPAADLPEGSHRVNDASRFVLAGNAVFTVQSKASGKRFTFKVRQPKADGPHFVSVLTGSDNTGDYQFVGSRFADGTYRHGKRSSIAESAPSAKAAQWLFRLLQSGDSARIEAQADVYHAGRCGRCGRLLTVPSSIESGIGPECAQKMG
jgi:hypothetical protein